MPNGDNIGVKSILVMSPIYMPSQSGALCTSFTHFLGRQDFFWFVNLLPEFTKNVLRDYKAWLVTWCI